MSLASEVCSIARRCCLLSLLFPTSTKSIAGSSVQLNSTSSKYQTRSVPPHELSSDESGPAAFRGASPLSVPWSTTRRCWTSEFVTEHVSWRAETFHFRVTLVGVFPRGWLNGLLPSACKLLILVVLLLTGCWYPCCETEEKDLWYHQRFGGDWSHWEEVKKQHSVEVSLVNSAILTCSRAMKIASFPFWLDMTV